MISIVCRSADRNAFSLSTYRYRVRRLLEIVRNAEAELSILIVDDDEMRALNAQYRQKDRTTDVLSFPQMDIGAPFKDAVQPLILGDIVLSMPVVVQQASRGCLPRLRRTLGTRSLTWSALDEATFLTVHGLLHLVGYDHINEQDASEMETAEAEILAELLVRGFRTRATESVGS